MTHATAVVRHTATTATRRPTRCNRRCMVALRILWLRSVFCGRVNLAPISAWLARAKASDQAKCPAMSGNGLKPSCALCATASSHGFAPQQHERIAGEESMCTLPHHACCSHGADGLSRRYMLKRLMALGLTAPLATLVLDRRAMRAMSFLDRAELIH